MADTVVAPQVNYLIDPTIPGPESDFEANFVLQTLQEWLEEIILQEVQLQLVVVRHVLLQLEI